MTYTNEYDGGEVMWQSTGTFLGKIESRKAFLDTTVVRHRYGRGDETFLVAECVLTLKPHIGGIGIVPEIKLGFNVDSDIEDNNPLDVFRRLIDEVEHKLSLGASERG